jgi:hypothetical protein
MQTDEQFKATIAELSASHGQVVAEPTTQIVCRKPTYAELNAFLSKFDGAKLDACRDLVISTAVHPERDELKRRYQESPGVLIPIATAVSQVGGATLQVDLVKG